MTDYFSDLLEDLFERDASGCLPGCNWPKTPCHCRPSLVPDWLGAAVSLTLLAGIVVFALWGFRLIGRS